MHNRHVQWILVCIFVDVISGCRPADPDLRPILKVWQCYPSANNNDLSNIVRDNSNKLGYTFMKSKLIYGENGEVLILRKSELEVNLIVGVDNVKIISTTKGKDERFYAEEASKLVDSFSLDKCRELEKVSELQ